MTTPASWQPDPEDPQNSLRYWDGAQWTGHTQPRVSTSDQTAVLQGPASSGTTRKKWPWVAGAAVVGVIAVGAFTNNNEQAKPVPASVVATSTTAATSTTRVTTSISTSAAASSTSSVALAPAAPSTTPVAATTPPAYIPPPATTPAYVPPPVVTTPAYVPPPPAYTPPESSGPATVHPGAFCSGGTGISSTGKPMVCATAKDGKMRWQSAN